MPHNLCDINQWQNAISLKYNEENLYSRMQSLGRLYWNVQNVFDLQNDSL